MLNSGGRKRGGRADAHRGEHSVDHFGPFAEAGNAMFEALDEERLGFDGLEFERHVFWCVIGAGCSAISQCGTENISADWTWTPTLSQQIQLVTVRSSLVALVLDDADE